MDTPWQGDTISLVEAFRSGERSPVEELQATYAAIDASGLNSVSHVDPERALEVAEGADVSAPFGGVPLGVKELDAVAGWPDTHASVALADHVADASDTKIQRLEDAGAVLFGLTTASEFGGVNQTYTKLNGATRNPWNLERTPGGSSGGSAAGVAGGLFTIATAGDGGGSIRIPAGFCGLFGLKCTWGRIPRGPKAGPGNLTAVPGCVSRSVRDTARWFDVSNGFDASRPAESAPSRRLGGRPRHRARRCGAAHRRRHRRVRQRSGGPRGHRARDRGRRVADRSHGRSGTSSMSMCAFPTLVGHGA